MVFASHAACFDCGKEYSVDEPLFKCECGSFALEVEYDLDKIKRVVNPNLLNGKHVNHWKYWMFYPVKNLTHAITIHEGETPLLTSRANPDYYFKYEGVTTTGSFKDRGTTIEVGKALDFNVKKVNCASTGNMGASVSAYSARAGLKCNIFVPGFAPKTKLAQIKAHGANLVKVKGSYDDAFRKVNELWEKKGEYVLGDYAFREDGEKSVAFEIADQLRGYTPDFVVCPVGMGTLISSTFKGFKELKEVGLIEKIPKIIGVQALTCNPVVRAWEREKKSVRAVKDPETIAEAINCGNPSYGSTALNAIKKSKGKAVSVTDKELMRARDEMSLEGIFVEPAGAVALAGAKKLKLKGKVVCVATGHGLKDPFVK